MRKLLNKIVAWWKRLRMPKEQRKVARATSKMIDYAGMYYKCHGVTKSDSLGIMLDTSDERHLLHFTPRRPNQMPRINMAAELWALIEQDAANASKFAAKGKEDEAYANSLANSMALIKAAYNIHMGAMGLPCVSDPEVPFRFYVIPPVAWNEKEGLRRFQWVLRFIYQRRVDPLTLTDPTPQYQWLHKFETYDRKNDEGSEGSRSSKGSNGSRGSSEPQSEWGEILNSSKK